MIDYNDMINLVNMIYGVKSAGTGQNATPPAQTQNTAAPMPATPATPMSYGQTPYTPVLPNALQAENDVLKDVIATLQRNALSKPVNTYHSETSGDILNNLINPPMTKE